MSKSKPCFKILGKKALRCHLETWKNQIGSIFKLNVKKSVKFQKKRSSLPPDWLCNLELGFSNLDVKPHVFNH